MGGMGGVDLDRVARDMLGLDPADAGAKSGPGCGY